MIKHFRQITYLSSCHNEFMSNSVSTSVAFMICAATTALHIYKIMITWTSNFLAMLPWIMNIKFMQWIVLLLETKFLVWIILHYVVGSSHRCTGRASTHYSKIQLVGLQVKILNFSTTIDPPSEWHATGPVITARYREKLTRSIGAWCRTCSPTIWIRSSPQLIYINILE
jgi:hypothetical protein